MQRYKFKIDKKQEKQKGITLVALVITVVVMLILAGVAIAAVVDGDGLFSKTRQAAETYENAAKEEGETIQSMINQIDEYLGNKNTGTGDGDGDDDNPPAGGAIIGEIVDENKTFTGGTEGSYSDPIIPKGFAPINENDAIWGSEDGYQKGLVIEDESGNQFVWVPVDGTTVKFERVDWNNENGLDASDCSETVPAAITTSVTNNGGFYIGRYEAGKPQDGTLATDGSIKPVSKQGATVWNEIAWSDNGTNDDTNPGNGAVTVARSMYPSSDNNYGAVSTLIYGTQWDTVLKFIGAYGGDATYATDSTGKGNYDGINGGDTTNEEPATCGLLDAFRQKNIYDMAGNVEEWTMESYSTERVYRGGHCDHSGSDLPASYRSINSVAYADSNMRVACWALYKVDLSPKGHRTN